MKLISLNTWGGKYFGALIDFIKQHAKDTDIFCLQEIYHTESDVKQYKNLLRANLLREIKKILKDYQVFFFSVMEGYDDQAEPVEFDLLHGPAIFTKNSISINSHQDYFIFKQDPQKPIEEDFSNLPTPLQYINFYINEKEFSVFNYHGTPFPADKLDAINRLEQAKKVKGIMDSKTGSKIIVGDFNLLPETESLKIIGAGMRNLIEEFNIERTRSNLSPFFGKADFQKFADYAFVSSDVKVIDFQVPDVKVSDHLPMILGFS